MAKTSNRRTKPDLITHPVRLRILMSLAGLERTPQQIVAALDNVPASSIYRHLQILLDVGLLEVVAERPVRGTVEKTLRVVQHAAQIGEDEAAAMSADAHRQAFLVYIAQLLHEFERYIAQPGMDFVSDQAGYHTGVLYATDEEWLAAIGAMNEALRPLLDPARQRDRKARRFATITLPALDEPQES